MRVMGRVSVRVRVTGGVSVMGGVRRFLVPSS